MYKSWLSLDQGIEQMVRRWQRRAMAGVRGGRLPTGAHGWRKGATGIHSSAHLLGATTGGLLVHRAARLPPPSTHRSQGRRSGSVSAVLLVRHGLLARLDPATIRRKPDRGTRTGRRGNERGGEEAVGDEAGTGTGCVADDKEGLARL